MHEDEKVAFKQIEEIGDEVAIIDKAKADWKRERAIRSRADIQQWIKPLGGFFCLSLLRYGMGGVCVFIQNFSDDLAGYVSGLRYHWRRLLLPDSFFLKSNAQTAQAELDMVLLWQPSPNHR